MKKVRINTVIKVFTIGLNGENSFFYHCKEFNVDICIKLGKIVVYYYKDVKNKKNNIHRLKSELLPKTSKNCVFLHAEIICNPT